MNLQILTVIIFGQLYLQRYYVNMDLKGLYIHQSELKVC